MTTLAVLIGNHAITAALYLGVPHPHAMRRAAWKFLRVSAICGVSMGQCSCPTGQYESTSVLNPPIERRISSPYHTGHFSSVVESGRISGIYHLRLNWCSDNSIMNQFIQFDTITPMTIVGIISTGFMKVNVHYRVDGQHWQTGDTLTMNNASKHEYTFSAPVAARYIKITIVTRDWFACMTVALVTKVCVQCVVGAHPTCQCEENRNFNNYSTAFRAIALQPGTTRFSTLALRNSNMFKATAVWDGTKGFAAGHGAVVFSPDRQMFDVDAQITRNFVSDMYLSANSHTFDFVSNGGFTALMVINIVQTSAALVNIFDFGFHNLDVGGNITLQVSGTNLAFSIWRHQEMFCEVHGSVSFGTWQSVVVQFESVGRKMKIKIGSTTTQHTCVRDFPVSFSSQEFVVRDTLIGSGTRVGTSVISTPLRATLAGIYAVDAVLEDPEIDDIIERIELGQDPIQPCMKRCDPGFEVIEGKCLACASGKYTEGLGVICSNPPANAIVLDTTSFVCNAGHSEPVVAHACSVCAAGKFKNATGNNASACVTCASGKYTINSGSICSNLPANAIALDTANFACNAGYSEPTVAGLCSECTAGKFKNTTGNDASACVTCDSGKYTIGLRSICFDVPANAIALDPVNFACNAGYTEPVVAHECSACAAGKFKNETGNKASACLTCPANSSAPPGSDDVTDCLCNPGSSGLDGGICTTCAAGTYKIFSGSASCVKCLRAQFSTTVGATSNVCINCPAESDAPAGSDASSDCGCKSGWYESTTVFNPPFHRRITSGSLQGYFSSVVDSGKIINSNQQDLRIWCASVRAQWQWIQIDMSNTMIISGIISQGAPGWDSYVTEINVKHALHGVIAEHSGSFTIPNNAKNEHAFTTPVVGRHVTILPTSWEGYPCINIAVIAQVCVPCVAGRSSRCECEEGERLDKSLTAFRAISLQPKTTRFSTLALRNSNMYVSTADSRESGWFWNWKGESDYIGARVVFESDRETFMNGGSHTFKILSNGGFTALMVVHFAQRPINTLENIFDFGVDQNTLGTHILLQRMDTYLIFSIWRPIEQKICEVRGGSVGHHEWHTVVIQFNSTSGIMSMTIDSTTTTQHTCLTYFGDFYASHTIVGTGRGLGPTGIATTPLRAEMTGLYTVDAVLEETEIADILARIDRGQDVIQACNKQCPPGFEGIDDNPCQACASGKYTRGSGVICTNIPTNAFLLNTTDFECNAGYFESAVADVCSACAVGKFKTTTGNDASACVTCAAGTYNNAAGSASCVKCLRAQFSTTVGATSNVCINCAANSDAPAGSSAKSDCICDVGWPGSAGGPCTKCLAGQYYYALNATTQTCGNCTENSDTHISQASCICNAGSSGVDEGPCEKCAAGTYKNAPGSASCVKCLRAQFSTTVGATSNVCINCTANSDALAGSSAKSDCICNVGWPGSTGGPCTKCLAGQYYYALNATTQTCGNCSDNSDTHVSQASCTCNAGSSGADDGPCIKCAAGTYKIRSGNANCTACLRGQYSSVVGGAFDTCVNCTLNSDAPAASPAATHCICNAGSEGADGGPCTKCSVGSHKNVSGSAACAQCLKSQFATFDSCVNCTEKSHRPAASPVCTCNAGSSGPDGGPCVLCPPGTFKVRPGASACTACLPGEYSPHVGSVSNTCLNCALHPDAPAENAARGLCNDCVAGNSGAPPSCRGWECPINAESADGRCTCNEAWERRGDVFLTEYASTIDEEHLGIWRDLNVEKFIYSDYRAGQSCGSVCQAQGLQCTENLETPSSFLPMDLERFFQQVNPNIQCISYGWTALGFLGISLYENSTRVCSYNSKWFGDKSKCNYPPSNEMYTSYVRSLGYTANPVYYDLICPCRNATPGWSCAAVKCPAGKEGPWGGPCTQCPAGKFKPGGEDGACRTCEPFFTSQNQSASCYQCSEGYEFVSTSAQAASPGWGQQDAPCFICPAGKYRPASHIGRCLMCPLMSTSLAGSNACYECSNGLVFDKIVEEPPGWDPVGPQCVCEVGYGYASVFYPRPIPIFLNNTPDTVQWVPFPFASYGPFYSQHWPNSQRLKTCDELCYESPSMNDGLEWVDSQVDANDAIPRTGYFKYQYHSLRFSSSFDLCVSAAFSAHDYQQFVSRINPSTSEWVHCSSRIPLMRFLGDNGTSAACPCRALTKKCLKCLPGKYKDIESKQQCQQCPAGMDTVHNFAPGTIFMGTEEGLGNTHISDCRCTRDRITNPKNPRECLLCPPGFFIDASVGGVCSECASGKYNNMSEATSCSSCPPGSFSEARSSNLTQCGCIAGYESSLSAEAEKCSPCAVGKFNFRSSGACTACGAGVTDNLYTAATRCECQAGFIYALHQGCQQCPPGKFSYLTNNTVCTNCAADYFSTVFGATISIICQKCTAGSHSAEGSDERSDCICNAGFESAAGGLCAACAPGKYKRFSSEGACTKCAIAKYSAASAAVFNPCESCPAAATSVAGSAQLTDCECNAGYTGFHSLTSSAPCTACPAGKYKTLLGSSGCINCTVGRYSEVVAATSNDTCFVCPANRSSYAGSRTSTDCVCHGGLSGPVGGLCVVCAPGKYRDIGPSMRTNTACSDCARGTYSPLPAALECNACFQNSDSEAGSLARENCRCNDGFIHFEDRCATCIAGTYKDSTSEGVCTQCFNGTYSEKLAATSNVTCLACPNNTGSAKGSRSVDSCKCNPGYYRKSTADSSCLACPRDYFKAFLGDSACVRCPSGLVTAFTASVSTAQCICAAGFTGPDGGPCIHCLAGKFKYAPGSEACTLCAQGKYSSVAGASTDVCQSCPERSNASTGSSTLLNCTCDPGASGLQGGPCSLCAAGTYKPSAGSNQCVDCAGGNYSHAGARECTACAGNWSSPPRAAISMCGCPPGYMSTLQGSPDCAACPNGTFKERVGPLCSPCAAGKYSVEFAAARSDICVDCAAGKYSIETGSGYDTCQACDDGKISKAGSARADQCVCKVGLTDHPDGSCVMCEIGKSKWFEGPGKCSTCPDYMTTLDGDVFCSCSPGTNTYTYLKTSTMTLRTVSGIRKWVPRALAQNSWRNVTECTCGPGRSDLWTEAESLLRSPGICSHCAQGKFKSVPGPMACSFCPFNSISVPGSLVCACRLGFYGDDGGFCLPCPPGTFGNGARINAATICTPCPYNTVSSGFGMTSCEQCIHTHVPAEAATRCEMCRPGTMKGSKLVCFSCNFHRPTYCLYGEMHWCTANSLTPPGEAAGGPDGCLCHRGFTRGSTGAIGQVRPYNEWATCNACVPGYFSDTPNSLQCSPCAAGTHSDRSASNSSEHCILCPANTYSTGASTFCSKCPTNQISLAGSKDLADCSCAAGSTNLNGVDCVPCPPGTHRDNMEINRCFNCTADTFSLGGAARCTACPGITLSSPGANECNCPVGHSRKFYWWVGGPGQSCRTVCGRIRGVARTFVEYAKDKYTPSFNPAARLYEYEPFWDGRWIGFGQHHCSTESTVTTRMEGVRAISMRVDTDSPNWKYGLCVAGDAEWPGPNMINEWLDWIPPPGRWRRFCPCLDEHFGCDRCERNFFNNRVDPERGCRQCLVGTTANPGSATCTCPFTDQIISESGHSCVPDEPKKCTTLERVSQEGISPQTCQCSSGYVFEPTVRDWCCLTPKENELDGRCLICMSGTHSHARENDQFDMGANDQRIKSMSVQVFHRVPVIMKWAGPNRTVWITADTQSIFYSDTGFTLNAYAPPDFAVDFDYDNQQTTFTVPYNYSKPLHYIHTSTINKWRSAKIDIITSTGEGHCILCPVGMTSPKGATSESECECVSDFANNMTEMYPFDTHALDIHRVSVFQARCVVCPENYFRAGVVTTCQKCPANSFASVGADFCTCDAGYTTEPVFVPTPGLPGGPCMPCRNNTFWVDWGDGAHFCRACPAGKFSNAGSVGPGMCGCPPGQQRNSPNLTEIASCLDCVPGKYKGVLAEPHAQCSACANDTYSTGSAVLCTACRLNSVSLSGSPSAQHCKCAPGFEAGIDRVCSPCAGNSFKSSAGDEACELTGVDTFVRNLEHTLQSAPSPLGAPGYVMISVFVEPAVPPNTGGDPGIPCPPNSDTDGVRGNTFVSGCLCSPGWMLDKNNIQNGTCVTCPRDSFKNFSSPGPCRACPLHSTSPPGSTDISECRCKPGFTRQDSPVHTRADADCKACAIDTYKASIGDHACTPCIADTFMPTVGSVRCFIEHVCL